MTYRVTHSLQELQAIEAAKYALPNPNLLFFDKLAKWCLAAAIPSVVVFFILQATPVKLFHVIAFIIAVYLPLNTVALVYLSIRSVRHEPKG